MIYLTNDGTLYLDVNIDNDDIISKYRTAALYNIDIEHLSGVKFYQSKTSALSGFYGIEISEKEFNALMVRLYNELSKIQ